MMTPAGAGSGDSPIEVYLDELVAGLRAGHPRQLRHLLAETEAHLHDDAERLVRTGRDRFDAECEAVANFGPAAALLAAERAVRRLPISWLVHSILTSAVELGGVAAVAVGVSGVVAAGVRAVAGSRVLAAPVPGQALAASDCARWLSQNPHAGSCRAAATADWASEVVAYRIAAGVLGLLALAMLHLAWGRWGRRSGWHRLPAAVSHTLGLTLFGAAAVWTSARGADSLVTAGGDGAGQWLSAAPVAAAAAAVFAVKLLGQLRQPDLAGRPATR